MVSLQSPVRSGHLTVAVGHEVATPSGSPHGTDEQRIEDHQQRQRQEREQRLVGVLVRCVGVGFPQ